MTDLRLTPRPTWTHPEQLAAIEALIEQAAAASSPERERLLRKAILCWEACTRDESTPDEVMRVEAMLTAMGVPPAKEYPI